MPTWEPVPCIIIDLFIISLLKPQISQITQINKKQILELRTGLGYKIESAKVNHRNTETLRKTLATK
ncbi:MAG: hypothetical protein A3G70_05275 [Planctomycetes bacterium RIFCSPLOWO2_12_FULL_39_13]|nr:MAG: hypothetical protein A3G70_05275 [Planctomycetes bacterium RIFCSPLOWO2_12_FULL_39_13]